MIALQSSNVRAGIDGFALPHQPQPRLQHLTHGVQPRAQWSIDQVGVALGVAALDLGSEVGPSS